MSQSKTLSKDWDDYIVETEGEAVYEREYHIIADFFIVKMREKTQQKRDFYSGEGNAPIRKALDDLLEYLK